MADNLTLYNALRTPPTEALKTISGGRLNGKTDINPMWRIEALTEQFGPCGMGWWYTVQDMRMTPGADGEIAAFVDILLYYRLGDEVSMPIPGTGGSAFVAKERGGLYTSDECYKMALTDAISVAAKALGVAADVYWDKDRTKYTQPAPVAEAQSAKPQNTKAKKRNEAWNELRNKYGLDKGGLQSVRATMIEQGLLDDAPSEKMTENAYYDMLIGMEQWLVSAGYEARSA